MSRASCGPSIRTRRAPSFSAVDRALGLNDDVVTKIPFVTSLRPSAAIKIPDRASPIGVVRIPFRLDIDLINAEWIEIYDAIHTIIARLS